MARTRSKPSKTAPKESTPEPATSNAKPLPPSSDNPPKLFVLPKNAAKDARIVTLDNPSNETPSRYFFCPEHGFCEFTRIAAPRKACRSWLITPEKGFDQVGKEEQGNEQEELGIGPGYITKTADLFLATPIDLLFLILPALAPKSATETKQHFLALDDHLDTLCNSSRHWKALLAQYPTLKGMIEKRMGLLCDTVDAGDEIMYRISNMKLAIMLLKKAERMCEKGLPSSIEEKFVKSALEVPIMNIRREESMLSVATATAELPIETSQAPTATDSQFSMATSADSQTTIETMSTTATSITTEELSRPSLETPPEVPNLLRLRTALTYLTSSYLPPTFRTIIQNLLSTSNSGLPDFASLDTHLAAISKLKAEALALRSISDNISRKRGLEEDEERIAEREEKKRKKEEEEKKKKTESRGIKQLKKADTSGMKKLSSFFTKAPAKKA